MQRVASEAQRVGRLKESELSTELAGQWRSLTRAATFVALLSAPAVVIWLHGTEGW